jgi:hypothetical protein
MVTSLMSLSLLPTVSSSFAQGLVHFANSPVDLISYGAIGSESAIPANETGVFYFALLVSTNPAGPFTFTGVYATNDTTAGRIGPGAYSPTVPNWPICNDRFYEIAGWSSNLGAVWNSGWLVNNLPAPGLDPIWSGAPTNSYFGLSGMAAGAASGPGELCGPAFPLFGGTGLSGFNLAPVVVSRLCCPLRTLAGMSLFPGTRREAHCNPVRLSDPEQRGQQWARKTQLTSQSLAEQNSSASPRNANLMAYGATCAQPP